MFVVVNFMVCQTQKIVYQILDQLNSEQVNNFPCLKNIECISIGQKRNFHNCLLQKTLINFISYYIFYLF